MKNLKEKIVIGEEILFMKHVALFCGIITEVREKSVKVDYCWIPIWGSVLNTVFEYTTYIPISQLVLDNSGTLTVKNWFKNNMDMKKLFHIKKYMIVNNQKSFI
jgi:hypothetical protein